LSTKLKLFRTFIGLWLLLIGSHSLFALAVQKSVYIHAGLMVCIDSSFIPSYSISFSDAYSQQQELIRLIHGDTLELTIYNQDSMDHSFFWRSKPSMSTLVASGGNASIQYIGTFSGGDYLRGNKSNDVYMGLILPLFISNGSKSSFLWDIHEKNKTFSEELIQGNSVDFANYDPDYFFINGQANPQTLNDSLSRVTGNTGDSILIYIVNSGKSVHSLHFHGYHLEILQSSFNNSDIGRSKDTFPLRAGEIMLLLLVPDKPGEYPVHDHNLIAVSGGGIYPNGMFTTLLIQ